MAAKTRRPRRDTLFTVAELWNYVAPRAMTIAGSIPGDRGLARNKALWQLTLSEPMWFGAVNSVAYYISSARYRLVGPRSLLQDWHQVLADSEFGLGFQALIASTVLGALTSDSGGWIEIVRDPIEVKTLSPVIRVRGDSGEAMWVLKKDPSVIVDPGDVISKPDGRPMLISVDPKRCIPTDDPRAPLEFHREDGVKILLRDYQTIQIVDLRMPGTMWSHCAASRALLAISFMAALTNWHVERVTGTTADTMVLTNVPAGAIEAGLRRAADQVMALGNGLYVPPVFFNPLDPSAAPEGKVIHLRDLPDGFSFSSISQWYITTIAACIGVDYAFLAPLPGSRLGVATEAEVMARVSSHRVFGFILRQLETLITGKVLPDGIRLEFPPTDFTEMEITARAARIRAEERAVRIKSGEITAEIARQLAADHGDLPTEYLEMLGEEDVTPPWSPMEPVPASGKLVRDGVG